MNGNFAANLTREDGEGQERKNIHFNDGNKCPAMNKHLSLCHCLHFQREPQILSHMMFMFPPKKKNKNKCPIIRWFEIQNKLNKIQQESWRNPMASAAFGSSPPRSACASTRQLPRRTAVESSSRAAAAPGFTGKNGEFTGGNMGSLAFFGGGKNRE